MQKNPYDRQDMSNSIVADLIREERCLLLECCGQQSIVTHRDIDGLDEFMTAQEVVDQCRCTHCGGAPQKHTEVKAYKLVETCPTCGQPKLKPEYENHALSLKGGWALGVDDSRGFLRCQCD